MRTGTSYHVFTDAWNRPAPGTNNPYWPDGWQFDTEVYSSATNANLFATSVWANCWGPAPVLPTGVICWPMFTNSYTNGDVYRFTGSRTNTATLDLHVGTAWTNGATNPITYQ